MMFRTLQLWLTNGEPQGTIVTASNIWTLIMEVLTITSIVLLYTGASLM